MKLTFGILLIVFVAVMPLVLIWAVNTLFPVAAIPFVFETWLAALVIGGMFSKNTAVK
jgi:hypothetical protein